MISRICSIASAAILVLAGLAALRVPVAAATVTGTASVSGRVTNGAGAPVSGAAVMLVGLQTVRSTTDAQGRFLFTNVALGAYQIVVSATGLGTASRANVAVERDTVVDIQYEATASRLPVIATAQTRARFNVTAASVSVLNPAADAFEGQTTWREILEQLPAVSVAGAAGGTAFNAAIPDSPLSPAIVSINGANGYETATVFDGMPLIGTSYSGAQAGAGTDLGLYPMNAFSSVDVVRGPGALSPTIVDSLGGSLILGSPGYVARDGGELAINTDPYGGFNGDATVALRFGRSLSMTATYGVNDSPGPVNGAEFPAYPTVPFMVDGQSFTCGTECPAPQYFHTGYQPYAIYGIDTGFLTCCMQASTAWSQYGGSMSLRYNITPNLVAQVFYAGQRTAAFEGAPLEPVDFTAPAGYTGSYAPGNSELYFYQGFYSPVPFVQASSLLEEKIVAGIGRGVLTVAAMQNKTFITETFNQPGPSQPYMEQLYGSGTIGGTPAVLNGGEYLVTTDAFHYQENDFSFNRDLSARYDTQLGNFFTLGASYVKSYYDSPEDESYQYTEEAYGVPGVQTYNLVIPTGISESTNEARIYAGLHPSDETSVDVSYYMVGALYHVPNPNNNNEYVNQNLSYSAPRLGFVWYANNNVEVRAAAGGGLALAPLFDLVGTNGVPTLNPLTNTYSVTVTNLNLRPETSFGFDLGTDVRLPAENVLSFDLYRDNVYGQLYTSTSLTGTFAGLPLYTSEALNLAKTRYEGILLSLRHDVAKGVYGGLMFGMTRAYVMNVPNGFYDSSSCTRCVNLAVVPNINLEGGGIAGGATVPYAQGSATVGYRWSPQTYVELDPTYYGPNNTYYRPAFFEADGRVSYGINQRISLIATFRNITGVYDGSVYSLALSNLWGIPTIAGPADAAYGEEYGPRAVILTSQIRF